jgi:hypothetical protein
LQHGLACPAGAMRVNSIDWLGGGAEPQKQIVSARYGVLLKVRISYTRKYQVSERFCVVRPI